MTATTAEFILVDGVPLNTWAWNIVSGTGRITTPEYRGEDIVLPGRSGTLYVPNKALDVGTFSLTMWVLGCLPDGSIPEGSLRQTFEENKDRLMRVFSTRHRLLHIEARRPDGSVRECYAQVLDSIDGQTVAGRTRAEFVVSFVIPDVYWQDIGPQVIEVPFDQFTQVGTEPYTCTVRPVVNMTGVCEDAVIEVVGPVNNPLIREETGGTEVQLFGQVYGAVTASSGAKTAPQVWTVDVGTWASTINGQTAYPNAGTGGSVPRRTVHRGHARYLVIPPEAEFTFTWYSVAGQSSSTVLFRITFRRKYLMA